MWRLTLIHLGHTLNYLKHLKVLILTNLKGNYNLDVYPPPTFLPPE